jgi:triacylglycerol lipase
MRITSLIKSEVRKQIPHIPAFLTVAAARLPRVYKALKCFKMDTGAFSQLTTKYMETDFNPRTPNVEGVEYVS